MRSPPLPETGSKGRQRTGRRPAVERVGSIRDPAITAENAHHKWKQPRSKTIDPVARQGQRSKPGGSAERRRHAWGGKIIALGNTAAQVSQDGRNRDLDR